MMTRAFNRLASMLLIAAAALPLHAQNQRPVQLEDYGQWESLGSGTLSPNGEWLAVPISRVNRENELRIHRTNSDSVIVVAYGARPAFSRDGLWVAYAIGKSEQETEEQAATIRSSNHAVERAERVHGRGYMSWDGWDHLDVAPSLKPKAGDVMVASTAELHQWLQERHITTLIYTGFCSNLCIVSSPAAMAPMNGLGYRCVLLREGTMAVEFPDQPQNLHTDASLRYIESWVGYTASVSDFLTGLTG